MQHPFPVFLNLTGRLCVVFGSGSAAEEKAAALKAAGALVRNVVTPPEPADLDGAFLAVSTSQDAGVNRLLFDEAARRGVLFNALDDPPHCQFYFPAVHRQGALVVALSTSGRCPALAVRLKEKLAGWIGPEYAQFLDIAAATRTRLRQSGLSFAERRRIWYRVVDSPALELLRAGRRDEAGRAVATILDEETSVPASAHTLEVRP
jgi:siroheme synthase (precorrin-2 oxidase/ferrochelatase)